MKGFHSFCDVYQQIPGPGDKECSETTVEETYYEVAEAVFLGNGHYRIQNQYSRFLSLSQVYSWESRPC